MPPVSAKLSSVSQHAWSVPFLATLICAVLLLAGCSSELPSYRYRLTVEVDTPEGLRTGSTIIEVRTYRGAGIPGPEAAGISSRYRGEAAVVDLGDRGILFALLRSPDDPDNAAAIAPTTLLSQLVDRSGTPEAWGNNLSALKAVVGTAEVPAAVYPMLVTFRDLNVPASVMEVDPANLAASFGPGVRLRRMTAEITEEPVSRRIDATIPWAREYLDTHLDGTPARVERIQAESPSAMLSARSFSTEY